MTSFLSRLRAQAQAQANENPKDSTPAPAPVEAASDESLDAGEADGVSPELQSDVGDDEGFSLEDSSVDENAVGSGGQGPAPLDPNRSLEPHDSAVESDATPAELFQQRLNAFDAFLAKASGLTQLNFDEAKAHVRTLMEDLRVNPEQRGLIIDRDMHNIMLFIQASSQNQENKVVATAVKREKKAVSGRVSSAAMAALDMLDGPGMDLDSLSAKNTDSIATKVR